MREYRPPTRFSRAAADATLAMAALATGRASPAQAAAAVRADLLDTYQGRLRLALEQFAPAARSGFDARAAQAAALARGYWEILADAFAAERGAGARARATAAFDRLTASAGGGGAGAGAQVVAVTARLEGFRAVPLPAEGPCAGRGSCAGSSSWSPWSTGGGCATAGWPSTSRSRRR